MFFINQEIRLSKWYQIALSIKMFVSFKLSSKTKFLRFEILIV